MERQRRLEHRRVRQRETVAAETAAAETANERQSRLEAGVSVRDWGTPKQVTSM